MNSEYIFFFLFSFGARLNYERSSLHGPWTISWVCCSFLSSFSQQCSVLFNELKENLVFSLLSLSTRNEQNHSIRKFLRIELRHNVTKISNFLIEFRFRFLFVHLINCNGKTKLNSIICFVYCSWTKKRNQQLSTAFESFRIHWYAWYAPQSYLTRIWCTLALQTLNFF